MNLQYFCDMVPNDIFWCSNRLILHRTALFFVYMETEIVMFWRSFMHQPLSHIDFYTLNDYTNDNRHKKNNHKMLSYYLIFDLFSIRLILFLYVWFETLNNFHLIFLINTVHLSILLVRIKLFTPIYFHHWITKYSMSTNFIELLIKINEQ